MRQGFVWLALLFIAGCSPSGQDGASSEREADNNAFTILAGSELKELSPAIEAAAQRAGVPVKIAYSGTLEMVDRINSGERFDAILPPNGAYPSLALTQAPRAKEKLFYSRVALGVKESKARELGWSTAAPTWTKIASAVRDGKLVYAMTNPTSSNTGMSALFAVASSVAGKTEDLSVEEVNREVLKDFLKGQKLTAGSSGWLAEAYLREQNSLDGLVNYEAVLLRLNENPELREKLTLIYPQDGVISADYPLMLLDETERARFDKLVTALKAKEFQSEPLAREFLRPSNPDAPRAPKLPGDAVAELAFPNRLEVIDAVLMAYQSDLRRPSTSIYVLDVSGSMEGRRLAAMKEALRVLTGVDTPSVAARFARFQNRERVILLPFASRPRPPQTFAFENPDTREATNQAIRQFGEQLNAHGGTAIYSSLEQAYQIANAEIAQNPDRLVSVVLLTDGENTEGLSFEQFRTARSNGGTAQVRTFPILFGESRVDELEELGRSTGGRVFEGRGADLSKVFREIRGYQ